MLLIVLSACTEYSVTKVVDPPLSLTITSPTYGEFLGDEALVVTGVVTPSDAALTVNDQQVQPASDGSFTVTLDWTDRAMLVYARATRAGEIEKIYVPVFDGVDPRGSDPGAVRGLLTPLGLDGLEPLVADMVDSLGWEDQIFAILPVVDTDYFDLTPTSVTSDGATVDLSPGENAVRAAITLNNVAMTVEVNVFDFLVFPMTITLGQIGVGADASPTLTDDMLSLALANLEVTLDEIGMDFGGLEVPDWLMELIADPIAGLVADLGTYLGDLLLDQLGTFELGGPFAFSFDLAGTELSARLAEVGADLDGVGLGITIGYDEEAAAKPPGDLAELAVQTPSGLDYELGLGVHEGMFNVLMDQVLSGFLDIDMNLEGDYGELMGAGFSSLPGGDQMPEDRDGFCLALHSGDARVVRMVTGTGAPIAVAYLPDLRVQLDVLQEGSCNPWLDAVLMAKIDLNAEGTAISADFDISQAIILEYGATGVNEQEVAQGLGDVVGGLAGLLAGNLSFDLGDALSLGGLTLNPQIISVEPLDDQGLYGVYLKAF